MESAVSGYHLVLRADGSLELFRRPAGQVEGTLVRGIATTPPVTGEWVRLQLDVSRQAIGFFRLDGEGWGTEVADATYRGGYLWLCKNYPDGPPVQFRSITVEDRT